MNAGLEAINVMRMPTVPTLLALMIVPARKDLLEMDIHVQVCCLAVCGTIDMYANDCHR